jgi:N-acetylglucosaminyldiphosphoundecaprenol N-acetyl-beta-D-mannosaminyltransferase
MLTLSRPGRLKILDVWVDPVDMEEALARAERFLSDGSRPHSVFAVNPEKSFSVPRDPELYETFRQADLLIPDGIGVVLAARWLHGVRLSRVTGVEFVHGLCGLAVKTGHSVFLYGAREEVNARAVDALKKNYPGLKVAGRCHGYLEETEVEPLIARINESGAGILLLALGSPLQERWFATHQGKLENVRVVQGVGGTLDTLAGRVKRAPELWRRLSLEWLYRLISEPKRFRRQQVLPVFVVRLVRAKLHGA